MANFFVSFLLSVSVKKQLHSPSPIGILHRISSSNLLVYHRRMSLRWCSQIPCGTARHIAVNLFFARRVVSIGTQIYIYSHNINHDQYPQRVLLAGAFRRVTSTVCLNRLTISPWRCSRTALGVQGKQKLDSFFRQQYTSTFVTTEACTLVVRHWIVCVRAQR